MDDEDVELMFDEWEEATAAIASNAQRTPGSPTSQGGSSSTSAGGQPSCKMHIYVQWKNPAQATGSSAEGQMTTGGEGQQQGGTGTGFNREQGDGGGGGGGVEGSPEGREHLAEGGTEVGGGSNGQTVNKKGDQNKDADGLGGGTGTAVGSEEDFDGRASPEIGVVLPNSSKSGNGRVTTGNGTARGRSDAKSVVRHRRRAARAAPSHASSIDLPDLVERMEIIDPSDIALVKFLGSGGYGDVYLGRWHGCEVAVKCLNPALFFQGGGEPGAINRAAVTDLIKEADMLGSLRHPNVVWVYGMVLPDMKNLKNGGNHDGEDGEESRHRNIVDVIQAEAGAPSMMPGVLRPPALVTEYMAGGSLKTALARKADIVAGPLTRIVLALDAAKGVEYLHSKRLVHFDLKSGNLLLGYRDRRPVCKVADFGLAREKSQTFVSGVTSQRGTLPWTAPEILRTPHAVTEAVDVFSFGICMWELWTGREPYEGLNYHMLMLQLANPDAKLRPPVPGTPEWDGPEGSAPPELAPGWKELMERCWEEDPEKRPPFTQIVKELRAMVAAARPARGGNGASKGRVGSTAVPPATSG